MIKLGLTLPSVSSTHVLENVLDRLGIVPEMFVGARRLVSVDTAGHPCPFPVGWISVSG